MKKQVSNDEAVITRIISFLIDDDRQTLAVPNVRDHIIFIYNQG